jgi:hypothetical protein
MQTLRFQILLFSFLLFNFAFLISKSQSNLVPNPSFEDTVYCPTTSSAMGAVKNWSVYAQTPDYYNLCANGKSSPSVGIPSNWAGYQVPFHGNAYCGIGTYDSGTQREFLGVELTQTLSIGTKYFVSAYISRADSFPFFCSANRFSFRFSTIAFDIFNPVPVDNFSHISSATIVNDTLNWTKISGSFTADSAYKYFIIGNFYDNMNTITAQCTYTPVTEAYYFIDKVCVSTDSNMCNIITELREYANNSNFSIYPNPAVDYIIIDFLNLTNSFDVIITDVFRRKILTQTIYDTKTKINISNLPIGIFFVEIFQNNLSHNFKLLKQ